MSHCMITPSLQLPVRNELHLKRKAFHAFMGLIIVFSYSKGVHLLFILSICLMGALILESLRLKHAAFNQTILRLCGSFMRSHEIQRYSSVPQYLLAAILVIALFPKPVALLSLLYLACGDPMASLVGILWGHLGPRFSNGKTLIGSVAGVLTCMLLTAIFLYSYPISKTTFITLTLLGGCAGGLTELLPWKIDDNFTIPVVSGIVLFLSFRLYSIY